MASIKINGESSGSTTITAPATGGDESIELSTVLDSKLPIAGGKILQIVRATDSTDRTTTSISMVDVTGMSVTITPQKSDSALFIFSVCRAENRSSLTTATYGLAQITDSGNNAISGAELVVFGNNGYTASGTRTNDAHLIMWGYATPATTSAVTYKVRFRSDTGNNTVSMLNSIVTGQMYAIEVSA